MHQEFGMPVLELVFYMTRTFAYSLHRKKLILTDKCPYAIPNLCHTKTNAITFSGTDTNPSNVDVYPSNVGLY